MRVARTARLPVAAGVMRDHLPATVAEHARSGTTEDTCVLYHTENGKSKTHGHAHSEKIHRETYTFRTSPY